METSCAKIEVRQLVNASVLRRYWIVLRFITIVGDLNDGNIP
jgi:hypothetical protein